MDTGIKGNKKPSPTEKNPTRTLTRSKGFVFLISATSHLALLFALFPLFDFKLLYEEGIVWGCMD